jgi:hypothetical protein
MVSLPGPYSAPRTRMEHLHRDIDTLSSAATVGELAASTQKVLRTMAFYVSQSETAVLEHREAWHDEFADALYSAAGKSRNGSDGVGRPGTASANSRPERKTGGKKERLDTVAGGSASRRPERKTGGKKKERRGPATSSRGAEAESVADTAPPYYPDPRADPRAVSRARSEHVHQAYQRTLSARPSRTRAP